MPKSLPTPDRLFDRTWRPGHPFSPRVSSKRRWIMGILFLVLCTIIGGYWYLTDSNRVRRMAEQYLSTLLGGPVKVGDATLSIFEGLRLDNVRLYVDESESGDSLLFSAHSFLIQYDPKALVSGHIDATRIVVVDPHVHVSEDAATGRRNYSRLSESRRPASMPSGSSGKPIVLPEIVLRNAQVDYSRQKNGVVIENNSIGIEGQLTPVPESKIYAFAFQSRGKSAGIGPMVSGQMVMGTGQITASLQNFEFGPDVKTMLPPDVRQWWEQHELTGRLNVPVLEYLPPSSGNRAGYRVEIELQGVTLAVHPEEWMGADEDRKLRGVHRAFDAMRLGGLNGHGLVNRLASLVEPTPLNLKQVHGRFTFADDKSIEIEDLNGWLEEVPFKIEGKIRGYTPSAQARLRIASSALHDIEIPAAPRYLNSLPPAVREIYDRFKPRGVCRFWVDLDRPTLGARPSVTGQIEIIDGNFTFDRFPYPLRKVVGKIILAHDPHSGEESLTLDHIRGRGVENGPNANSFVEVNGFIGPFGPDTRVDVTIAGQQIRSEPALMAAFPAVTRQALKLFDAPGQGEFPKFGGDFVCSVLRARGSDSHWIVDTNIRLEDAAGALVGFPYPMSGVSGDLKIHDDNLELANITMNRGDSTLRLDGRVSWPSSDQQVRPASGPILKPDLKVVARNVPVDRDLLNALPPARRAWLQKIGAGGRFDLDGTIKPAKGPSSDLDLDLRIAIHDGTLLPSDGVFAVSNLEGNLRLTNQRLTLGEVRGRRGSAELAARGEITWPDEKAKVVLQAEAKNLTLEDGLYRLLPEAARTAWDQVRPEGTIDVSLNYSGAVAETNALPATQPSAAGGYELVLTPRTLSATPLAVPYRLDGINGTVTVTPDKVLLKDLKASHGAATVRLAGAGSIGQQRAWDFALAADNVPVDDDLRRAVPQSLAGLLTSIQMKGVISFEFPKLQLAFAAPQSSSPAASAKPDATTKGADSPPPDVDFDVILKTDAVAMDVGVPLSDVKGITRMSGSSRNGKLSSLDGTIDVDSLTLAARPVTNFRAVLLKSPDHDQLTIGKMEARLAGGSMAGQVDYAFPDTGPSRYAINLTLRNADVRDLAGESEQDLEGQLSASLALEGTAAQPASRRGRGDVSVVGEHMYRIPLVLGLLQITNLSLPVSSPFTQASVRYSIDGMRVTFEQIELRSKEMLMQGDGHLDFDTKQVKMRFVTDSTSWPKIPLIGDLIQGARHELLQIQVRGTLQEPKVSARSMNTFTTTVDEVFKGDEKPTTQKKAK